MVVFLRTGAELLVTKVGVLIALWAEQWWAQRNRIRIGIQVEAQETGWHV
jgi:hypothetical protein